MSRREQWINAKTQPKSLEKQIQKFTQISQNHFLNCVCLKQWSTDEKLLSYISIQNISNFQKVMFGFEILPIFLRVDKSFKVSSGFLFLCQLITFRHTPGHSHTQKYPLFAFVKDSYSFQYFRCTCLDLPFSGLYI